MDHFKVTHSWAEPDPHNGKVRTKLRYGKLDFSTDGWWSLKPSTPEDNMCQISSQTCNKCGENTPIIYTVGWMCGNPMCSRWFKVSPPPLSLLHCPN